MIIQKLTLKIESPLGAIIHKANKIFLGKKSANEIKFKRNGTILKRKFLRESIWDFYGIKLPFYKNDSTGGLMYLVYLDSLFVYCNHDDNYESELIDRLDNYLPEGAYGYKNKEIDVTVKKNDIVIDAGAWIGDFSAYASRKGSIVYAFEPSKENIKYLQITKELNSNIFVIEKGLSDKSGISYFSTSLVNSLIYQITDDVVDSEKIELTTIDDFVFENKLDRVDFIKSDIEGFERNMLLGAKNTLKQFAPKLSICTYHLPDDPNVISRIILEANPKYKIVQRKNKLYAMVTE